MLALYFLQSTPMTERNGYYYQRSWFDFSFENQDKVTPVHTAMYLWFVELNNRMGWVEKFASPASQTMAAIGIKSYNTYIKIFKDLISFGIIKEVTPSINQYTACIIALSNFNNPQNNAHTNALDKSLMNQIQNHGESSKQTNDSIIKQKTKKQQIKEPITIKPLELAFVNEVIIEKIKFIVFWDLYDKKLGDKKGVEKKWDLLSIDIQEEIIKMLPNYIASIKDKQFQPYPATFLNQERWTNEIQIIKQTINDNTTVIPATKKGFDFSTSRCK